MNLLLDVVNQLVAVLRLGTRGSRYSVARVLEGIFTADHIIESPSRALAFV